ncbi:MAG: phosphate signaling complex protein PhoU [Sedimenticolaceae bacterium]|jgi:phosphate transport system protein
MNGYTDHTSSSFNADLERVRSSVLEMGGLIEAQLDKAITALRDSNITLAEDVIVTDTEINRYDVSIDEGCTRIFALRAPAASDLRLVQTVIRTTTDLERIGDEIKRVAKMAIANSKGSASASLYNRVEHLGNSVKATLHRALDAFARMDVDAAIEVAGEDKRIDQEYESMMRQLMTYMMEDPRSIPRILDIMWAARSLERIGDRCQNICEYIIYYVKGKDVRHTSLDSIRAEFGGDS